jgi:Fe-S cluster biogenesis protein NfuA
MSPFEERMRRVESLVREVEALVDPHARGKARDLLQAVLELHGRGLARILELAAGPAPLLPELARDELVSSLLLLHDLHPRALEERVLAALEKVRPYLHSHGGDVTLLAIEGTVLRLRLDGSCNGCPSSSETLRSAIEGAIADAAPDVTELRVEGVEKAPVAAAFIPLSALGRGRP